MSMLHLHNGESLLDGELDFYPAAVIQPDPLFDILHQQLPWHSDTITVYGKEHRIPRLQCWLGDAGLAYTYSGKTLHTLPWHPVLQQLNQQLNQALGLNNNSVLCNLYRDGNDSMGWHSDDEAELGPAPVVVSMTLGAERDFALRKKGETRMFAKLPLSHGSVLVMKAGMQSRWQHALPKRAGIASARINLTFRQLIQDTAAV
ncbi:alpha-ketoglutarate-dependent dioxygenase AlkB family protein [Oceanobacter kriegii]|uniref:alpha-ketoglutarate-dependent dioxygenase AlkB family protein n=1 Tax=Oceanobacter kriegii TaxID=64972 RepID=UPI0004802474|nr:alpha-ketoglutarate-dependent dioxygenase AlkB [Oceanobacter kriegii]